MTYYFNLSYANTVTPLWKQEYNLTGAFGVPDGTFQSMQMALEKLCDDDEYLQKYYKYNSVSYDLSKCDENCKNDQICAIKAVDFVQYKECVRGESPNCAATLSIIPLLLISVLPLQF